MSEVKYSHTPGPWKVKAAEFKGNGIVAYEIIMSRAEINQANANLIAAAPDLLQLCRESKYLLSKIESATDGREIMAIEGFSARLEAFIRKAEEGDAA